MDPQQIWTAVVSASRELAVLSLVYVALAVWLRGRRVLRPGKAFVAETRLNIFYLFLDAAAVGPLVVLAVDLLLRGVAAAGLVIVPTEVYAGAPWWAVLAVAVAVSDLVGYWRHRLMHTVALWPVHAIHHSDREMGWLALMRFHPLNRLITVAINSAVLAVLGLPGWAIVANGLIRHHYGFFIHANVPWTYGRLSYVFVSPVMHRWHHTRSRALSGYNFATVFAFYDVLFGTYRVPSKNVGSLGVDDPLPPDWIGQTLYPLRVWLGHGQQPVDGAGHGTGRVAGETIRS